MAEREPLMSHDHNSGGFLPHMSIGSTFHTCKAVLFSNYINVLLVFIPLGIVGGALGWGSVTVFILNFFAIIPLAALLSFATEELALKVGQTMGGLLNATFGNAVELIVSIVALRRGEIRIVQSSMLGSILSNILLVLGMCFVAGGLKHKEQEFNTTVASTMSSLMAVATSSLIIPAAMAVTLPKNPELGEKILVVSRATSIVLLILYILYLFFQLKTHASLYDGAAQEAEADQEEATLGPFGACVLLVLDTVLVAVCAEYLVGSIDDLVTTAGISKTFIGLILIPIVGNAAEHVTAVVVATKNKMDLAIGVAIGSSMQIALLVTPFLVILGWIIDQPMSMRSNLFDMLMQIFTFILSRLLSFSSQYSSQTTLSKTGSPIILKGQCKLGLSYVANIRLMGIYVIIAVSFYVYPDEVST